MPEIEDLGGLFRVCRRGWALRLDARSAGGAFEVFMVRGGGFCSTNELGMEEREERSCGSVRHAKRRVKEAGSSFSARDGH